MDKFDYVNTIIDYARGRTGLNFQYCLGNILESFYTHKGKTFEMPSHYGGDDKNDGWVIEEALFYQIYSPTQPRSSLRSEMQKKFSEDLEGLLELILVQNKWNGTIKEFIYIVNTFDNRLPHDSERYYEQKTKELSARFSVEFKCRVANLDYVEDLLYDIDDLEVLKQLSAKLRVMPDYNAVTERLMLDFIYEISGKISKALMDGSSIGDYSRVSSSKKIEINGLGEHKDDIEKAIAHLDVVEQAIHTMNQDILCSNRFERVKALVIEKYEEHSQKFQGIELLDRICQEIQRYSENKEVSIVPAKLLVIYIFDKCDIFIKDGVE